jgi:cytochrome c peroxidase
MKVLLCACAAFAAGTVSADQPTSYMPVDIKEDFATTMKRMQTSKPAIDQRQQQLLEERYDLSNHPASSVTMSRGKPIQAGVRVKLRKGTTWESLSRMSPQDIRSKDLFPTGFMPLPHPNHPEGGMVFTKLQIDEIKRQEQRDLTRFDLDFDLPDTFFPNFPHRFT